MEKRDFLYQREMWKGLLKNNVLRLSMGKQAKEASRRYEEEAVMQLWMDIFQTVMKA